MDAKTEAASLLARSKLRLKKRSQDALELYTAGLVAKLDQAAIALTYLRSLINSPPAGLPEAALEQNAAFYIDAYFAFFRASFDVLGQMVNQSESLALDEKSADFHRAFDALSKSRSAHPAVATYQTAKNSHTFKNLNDYRNCSLHRRSICLHITTTKSKLSPGYSTTGPLLQCRVALCDNPLDSTPKFKQKREAIAYCSSLSLNCEKHLASLLKSL
jgi:hypothetical protein